MAPDVVVVGSVNLDLRIEVAELPRPGQTVLAGDPSRFSGGKGANQAVALARLGHQVGLVGAVGDDADGGWLRAGLDREGVDATHLRSIGDSSGQAFVFVDPDGENSIVVSPGANARVSPDVVRAAQPWLVDAAATLVQCEIPAPAILEAARLSDGLFILNPAPAMALPEELWHHVDVVVPNRLELAHLTSADQPPVDDADVVRLARQLPCEQVVTTLGSAGAIAVDGDRVAYVEAPRVSAVDTTGAGDCFCAALADALIGGLGLADATRHAVRAASLSVMAPGAQTSAPTRAQLLAALDDANGSG
ncbi:MAG TPA: ribokinase [Nocardioidaceae bacterium]|nr:ribokinase [Nocardioidaceae bacterium]